MKPVTLHITKNPGAMFLDADHVAAAPGASLEGLKVAQFVIDADCLLTELDRAWFQSVVVMRAALDAPSYPTTFPCVRQEMDDEAIHDAAAEGAVPEVELPGVELPDTNPKSRIGLTKPSLGAIPSAALLHLGGAMADGRDKYGLFNWREHSVAASVYEDAIWRHLLAWRDGEDTARDSGHHHLAHVMACCAILLDAAETGNLIDDRGPTGAAADLIDAWTQKPLDGV